MFDFSKTMYSNSFFNDFKNKSILHGTTTIQIIGHYNIRMSPAESFMYAKKDFT